MFHPIAVYTAAGSWAPHLQLLALEVAPQELHGAALVDDRGQPFVLQLLPDQAAGPPLLLLFAAAPHLHHTCSSGRLRHTTHCLASACCTAIKPLVYFLLLRHSFVFMHPAGGLTGQADKLQRGRVSAP